jgi:hypothetical protein
VFQIVPLPAVDKYINFQIFQKNKIKETNKQGRRKFKAEDLNTVHTTQVFHLSN